MLQWLCTFPYTTSSCSSIWNSLCDLGLLSHRTFHLSFPLPREGKHMHPDSQTEQPSGKYVLHVNAPWPPHRFYKKYFSLRYQSVLPGSVAKKESRTLTNLFTLSWEEKNLKTSAFLSRGLIVNYTGKRKKKKGNTVRRRKNKAETINTNANFSSSPLLSREAVIYATNMERVMQKCFA